MAPSGSRSKARPSLRCSQALDPPLRRRLTDEQGGLRRHVNIYLRDDNIRDLDGLDTPLADGDELLVLPSVAGG